jgi:hypothetical protein
MKKLKTTMKSIQEGYNQLKEAKRTLEAEKIDYLSESAQTKKGRDGLQRTPDTAHASSLSAITEPRIATSNIAVSIITLQVDKHTQELQH